jgi:hypothetical protein
VINSVLASHPPQPEARFKLQNVWVYCWSSVSRFAIRYPVGVRLLSRIGQNQVSTAMLPMQMRLTLSVDWLMMEDSENFNRIMPRSRDWGTDKVENPEEGFYTVELQRKLFMWINCRTKWGCLLNAFLKLCQSIPSSHILPGFVDCSRDHKSLGSSSVAYVKGSTVPSSVWLVLKQAVCERSWRGNQLIKRS